MKAQNFMFDVKSAGYLAKFIHDRFQYFCSDENSLVLDELAIPMATGLFRRPGLVADLHLRLAPQSPIFSLSRISERSTHVQKKLFIFGTWVEFFVTPVCVTSFGHSCQGDGRNRPLPTPVVPSDGTGVQTHTWWVVAPSHLIMAASAPREFLVGLADGIKKYYPELDVWKHDVDTYGHVHVHTSPGEQTWRVGSVNLSYNMTALEMTTWFDLYRALTSSRGGVKRIKTLVDIPFPLKGRSALVRSMSAMIVFIKTSGCRFFSLSRPELSTDFFLRSMSVITSFGESDFCKFLVDNLESLRLPIPVDNNIPEEMYPRFWIKHSDIFTYKPVFVGSEADDHQSVNVELCVERLMAFVDIAHLPKDFSRTVCAVEKAIDRKVNLVSEFRICEQATGFGRDVDYTPLLVSKHLVKLFKRAANHSFMSCFNTRAIPCGKLCIDVFDSLEDEYDVIDLQSISEGDSLTVICSHFGDSRLLGRVCSISYLFRRLYIKVLPSMVNGVGFSVTMYHCTNAGQRTLRSSKIDFSPKIPASFNTRLVFQTAGKIQGRTLSYSISDHVTKGGYPTYNRDISSNITNYCKTIALCKIASLFDEGESIKVVDLGCGKGNIPKIIKGFKTQKVSLDMVDVQMTELRPKIMSLTGAHDRVNVEFYCNDMVDFMLESGYSYDLIILAFSLPKISSCDRALSLLRACKEHLSSKGRMIVSYPSFHKVRDARMSGPVSDVTVDVENQAGALKMTTNFVGSSWGASGRETQIDHVHMEVEEWLTTNSTASFYPSPKPWGYDNMCKYKNQLKKIKQAYRISHISNEQWTFWNMWRFYIL
jgi:2-polyprenyl-3-methyl-5-hydroxy-6-metoxy-1,4-benzoquinol methylase